MRAVSTQRERFQCTREVIAKARECCNLVLLSLYVFIPPSRGLEIRTLQIVREADDSLDARHLKEQNLLVMRDSSVVLHFNDYKTKTTSGRDEVTLQVRSLVSFS